MQPLQQELVAVADLEKLVVEPVALVAVAVLERVEVDPLLYLLHLQQLELLILVVAVAVQLILLEYLADQV